MVNAAFTSAQEDEAPKARFAFMERVDIDSKGKETVSRPIPVAEKVWLSNYAERGVPNGPSSHYFRLVEDLEVPVQTTGTYPDEEPVMRAR